MTKTVTTLSQFILASHLDAGLIRSVVNQFGGWEEFKESAEDVCRGGIDGGFQGFTYHSDTEHFAQVNRARIAELAKQQAEELGCTVTLMIKSFGCFKTGTTPTDEEIGTALYAGQNLKDGMNILNALAWYAGEEVCRAYADSVEAEKTNNKQERTK